MQFTKPKRDDTVREKQNATMQFAKNQTRRWSSRKAERDNAVHEKQNATMQFAKTNATMQLRGKQNANAVREKQNNKLCRLRPCHLYTPPVVVSDDGAIQVIG